MRLEEYRKIYDEVSLSKEADERILQALQEAQSSGKKRNSVRVRAVRIAAAAAVLVLAVGIMKFPAVASSTQDWVSRLNSLLKIKEEQREGHEYGEPTSVYEYSDSVEYLKIHSDAPKKECKMDSFNEVSEVLGVELLQSKDAYKEKNCIRYIPYVSDSGNLKGVILKNNYYTLGDIQEPRTIVFKDLEKDSAISYREGEKYHSPIMMEVAIRAEQDGRMDEEWNDSGGSVDLTEVRGGAVMMQEIYEIESLGVEAFLSENMPGSHAWNKLDGQESDSCTEAVFAYQGVEYRYVGAVSVETMLEFLEGLEIP